MDSFYGYNIIGNEGSARAHLQRLKPRVAFYMDSWGGAKWAADNLPNTIVVHRVYKAEEDTMHRTPGRTLAHLKERAAERQHDQVYINLSCEPQVGGAGDLQKLVSEQLAAMQWAVANGVRVAGPHGAFYGLSTDEHWRTLEPLTTYIAAHPGLLLFTVDEYFAGHAFSGVVDPGLPGGNEIGHIQPEHWRASPVPYYWHKGRITNFFRWLKANGKPLPPTVITEDGADALSDVETWRNSLVKAPGYTSIRGWQSLTSQWQAWYGARGWSPERAYLEMLVAFWREVYSAWPNILGSCLYCWGTNNDPQWNQFRLDGAAEFQQRLEATVFDMGGPIVTNPVVPVPKPTDAGPGQLVRQTAVIGYNVRSGPGTQYPKIASIGRDVEVTIYPATKRGGSGFEWVYTEPANGWVADEGQFTPVAPVFGAPAVQLDVPFQTQRSTGLNNCGEAALTMLLNYWLEATKRPGQVMIEDIIASVNNAGSYASLSQLKTAAAKLGLVLEARANSPMTFIEDELDAGRPFIALVERGDLPGTQAYYAFTGAHYVVVTGYGDGFVMLHDPLSLPGGPGVHLKVALAAFVAAWETTPGNSGVFQALIAPASQWGPVTPEEPGPEVPPDLYAAVLAQVVKQEQANAALAEAIQVHQLASAEVNESLKGLIGYQ